MVLLFFYTATLRAGLELTSQLTSVLKQREKNGV